MILKITRTCRHLAWVYQSLEPVADPEGAQQARVPSKFWSTLIFFFFFGFCIKILQNKAQIPWATKTLELSGPWTPAVRDFTLRAGNVGCMKILDPPLQPHHCIVWQWRFYPILKTCKKWKITLSPSMAMYSVMRDIHDARRVPMESRWVALYLYVICKYSNQLTLEQCTLENWLLFYTHMQYNLL